VKGLFLELRDLRLGLGLGLGLSSDRTVLEAT
jgi:hypothetical protein